MPKALEGLCYEGRAMRTHVILRRIDAFFEVLRELSESSGADLRLTGDAATIVIDISPDILPGIGYLDDAAVIAGIIKLIHEDVQNYRLWKQQNGK